MDIKNIRDELSRWYGRYAPVTSQESFTGNYYGNSTPGLFTPVRSFREAREVLVFPLHIAIGGFEYNAHMVLAAASNFLRGEIDAVTRLSPFDMYDEAADLVGYAIKIFVAVHLALYDALLSALTIVTRAASTAALALMVMGSGLNLFSSNSGISATKLDDEQTTSMGYSER